MGIPGHLTCLLTSLYASQEAAVRTRHGTTDWSQTGKGVHHGYILSPCLFNLYAEYTIQNVYVSNTYKMYVSLLGWTKHKLESRLPRKTSALLTMPKPLTVWITTNCGKILKETRLSDHLTCLLRNLYAGQEATV